MKKPAVEFRNVCKKFTYVPNRPESIKETVLSIVNRTYFKLRKEEKVVLDNVSFQIQPGESVAIMGRNGAGKSTMLRILAGIYAPDSGQVITDGLVAPMVALGVGFHGELSGYENIFLNGSILGIPRSDLKRLAKEIVDFSELGPSIHYPVKNYSNGMALRLGFSVAAFVDAPILALDEILTVGDEGFQRKCLMKITELFKSGRTVVLVTHDSNLARAFCNRTIVIEKGNVIYDGAPDRGGQVYIELFS